MSNILQRAIKPTPLKFIFFVIVTPLLLVIHKLCLPVQYVSMRLTAACGHFSEWLYLNKSALSFYEFLSGWKFWLLILVIVLWSLVYEINKPAIYKISKLSWGKAVGITFILLFI